MMGLLFTKSVPDNLVPLATRRAKHGVKFTMKIAGW